jgi:hypothetical protein
MGFFSGVLSMFKGSATAVDTASEVIKKTTDGIINGLDDAKFTDQERAVMQKQIVEAFLPMWVDLQKILATEGTASSLARRVLAFMIMGTFLGLIVFAVIIWHHDPKWAEFVTTEGVGRLEFLAGGVGLTYFVYYGITKFFKK